MIDSQRKSENVIRMESVQLLLPKELPFEKGTGLERQDACSRLMFQLLVERVLPDRGLPVILREKRPKNIMRT